MEDFKDRPLYFSYAWPLKDPKRSKRKLPPPPFPEAEPWQCSVYYYWWEYLKRHDGYKRTCAQDGRGRYAKLYEDFGNIHEGEFWEWWRTHNWIFAEPSIRQVKSAEPGETGDDHTLIIRVPLETSLAITTRQFKRLVRPQIKKAARKKMPSRAKYPVATKPILSALHEHLLVWDAKKRHPNLKDAVLSVCSHKLGHYAQRLKESPKAEHEATARLFEQLKQLCDQEIAKQSQAIWRQPERMGA
jgi:hypothetical protein